MEKHYSMKQESSNQTSPLWGGLRGASAILMLLFSIAISFMALLIPPPGVIDPSVLWVVAQALLFSASVLGLDSFAKRLVQENPH